MVKGSVNVKQPGTLIVYYRQQFKFLHTGIHHDVRWAEWYPNSYDALIVGNKGTLVTFDGHVFKRVTTHTYENLRCVSINPKDKTALIVGNKGTLLNYDGNVTSKVKLDVATNFRRISWRPQGDYAILVGNEGLCMIYDEGRVRWIEGSENNLRSISWHPSGKYAIITASCYRPSHAGLVPSPVVFAYYDGEESLQPLLTETGVDLIGSSWKPDGSYCIAVGYHLVLHEPRIYTITKNKIEQLPLNYPDLYLTGISWKPDSSYSLIVTGTPEIGRGAGNVIKYDERGFEMMFNDPYYFMAGLSWAPDGSKALVFGSSRCKTFTV